MSRRVYPTEEIPHLWAHGRRPEGVTAGEGYHNRQRNVFTTHYPGEDTIYSYGTHFPMARRLATKRGVIYLLNPDRASVTTNKHQHMVQSAIPDRQAIHYIHYSIWSVISDAIAGRAGAGQQLARYYQARIDAELAQALRPRIRQTTKDKHYATAARLRDDWQRLHAALGLRVKVSRVVLSENSADAIERVAESIDRNRKREVRLAEAKRKAIENLSANAHKEMERWRSDPSVPLREPTVKIAGVSHQCRNYLNYPMLRVRGESVETTQGANASLDDVRRLYRMLPRLRAKPTSVSGRKVGLTGYLESMIHSDAETLVIGCHRFPWAEVDRFCEVFREHLEAN